MLNQSHPELEQLDLLRAGLLDDTPDEKAALERHLAGCPECRAHSGYWQNLAAIMNPPLQDASLKADLYRARQTALAAPSHASHRSIAPYAVAAALLLAVTLTMIGLPTGKVSTPPVTTQTAQTIPDTYEDLDFYLWLANQDENHPDKGHTNPNNT
jgi:predicted anti-sigma-YlaC factor YlaD